MWFDSGLHVLEGYSFKTISDYVWKMAQGAKLCPHHQSPGLLGVCV